MTRLPLAILLLCCFFAVTYFGGGEIGASLECGSGGCLVSASSSPISATLGPLLFFALVFLPRRSVRGTDAIPGIFKKMVALFSDLFLVLMGFTAISAVPMLLVEYSHTGVFQWSFARDFTRWTDGLLTLFSVAVTCLAFLLLRAGALRTGSSSVGQYVSGYLVVSEQGKVNWKTFLSRSIWAGLYLWFWPVYFFYRLIKGQKEHSWDIRSGTKSVTFKYS